MMTKPAPGETVQKWLENNFGNVITSITGSNRVSIGPKLSGAVAIDVSSASAEAGAQEGAAFPATLNGFEPIKVTTPTVAGGVRLAHPHRYWYSFVEVIVDDNCIDAQGNILDDQLECESGMPRTVPAPLSASPARKGYLGWGDGGGDPAYKPAINLAEIHHQLPPLVPDGTYLTDRSEPWFIYGVDIHTAWYGEGVNPQPPTANGVGVFAYYQTVLMHERIDRSGDVVRFFNWPGQHLGECS